MSPECLKLQQVVCSSKSTLTFSHPVLCTLHEHQEMLPHHMVEVVFDPSHIKLPPNKESLKTAVVFVPN